MKAHSEARCAFRAGSYREAFELIRKDVKEDTILELEILQLIGRVDDETEDAQRLINLRRLTKHQESRCFAIIAGHQFEAGSVATALGLLRRVRSGAAR